MIQNALKNMLNILEIPIRISRNEKHNNAIFEKFILLAEDYAGKWNSPNDALSELKPARQMYRNLGVDPTRYRPSSEALLRRAIKRNPMPQINAAVDAANFISLRFLLPLGLYDLDKVEGQIVLRKGFNDEEYEGLGKPRVSLHDKYVLADQLGPFGNPSSDSMRTSVDLASIRLLMVVYLPLNYKRKEAIVEGVEEIYNFLRD